MPSKAYTWGQKSIGVFIDWNPQNVIIHRQKKTATSAGGYRVEFDANLAAQTIRLVPVRSINTEQPQRTTPDGHLVLPTWYAIGMPDFDIRVYDTFEDRDGLTLQCVFISRGPDYRIVAECIEHA